MQKALAEPLPDVTKNYSGWLKVMRKRWKHRRGDTSGAVSMPAMFRGVRTKQSTHWDIVQIRPNRTPGRFTLWLSIDGSLTSVPLRIPREFYIHLRTTPKRDQFNHELYQCEKVVRSLPRDRPCLNLYKLSVREDLYVEGHEHFIDITNDPNVDGVYELQVCASSHRP